MKRTTFRISQMDCPSEEQMIRMKIGGMQEIRGLEFDIPARELHVVHEGSSDTILKNLDSLNLGTTLVRTGEAGNSLSTHDSMQRRTLWMVLGINAGFFVLELIAGLIAGSMGLVADSLDMLADSLVYGLALMAVGGTVMRKKKVARFSGYLQMSLAIIGMAEVIRRFIFTGNPPDYQMMILVSVLALMGNAASLWLLQKSRSRDAHMMASMIFTANDVIMNIGVIAAASLVFITGSGIPDLLIGAFVFIVVVRGALRILKLAR